MQIGELARRTGTSTKTIRFYEGIGLLPEPERAPNAYRIYDESAVERLLFIRDAKATGLSLDEISAVLDLRERGEATCGHVMGLLQRHLTELDERIEALQKTRETLRAITRRAGRLDPADCRDPHRCQTIAPVARSQRRSQLPAATEIHPGVGH